MNTRVLIILIPVVFILTILIVMFFALPRLNAQVDFIAEKVEMTVTKENDRFILEVYGCYVFTNPHQFDLMRMFEFPVPLEYGQLLPDSVGVMDAYGTPGNDWEIQHLLGKRQQHSVLPDHSGFQFRTSFHKSEIKPVVCRYTQILTGDNFGYIVTTVRAWGKPLDRARFEIKLPVGYELAQSNYDFKRIEEPSPETGEIRVFWRYDAENFMPDEDIAAKFTQLNLENTLPDG